MEEHTESLWRCRRRSIQHSLRHTMPTSEVSCQVLNKTFGLCFKFLARKLLVGGRENRWHHIHYVRRLGYLKLSN